MHIRRMIDESSGVNADGERKTRSSESSRKDEDEGEGKEKGDDDSGTSERCEKGSTKKQRSTRYATIDSLALKRASLPLRLLATVTIDDDACDESAGEIVLATTTPTTTNRKSTPRRPSFKVRSGGAVTEHPRRFRARTRTHQQPGTGGGSFKVQRAISRGIGERLAMLESLVDENKLGSSAADSPPGIPSVPGEKPVAPVYEAISESIGERKADEATSKRARSPLANSSFLWGGAGRPEQKRASPRNEAKVEISPGNDDEATTTSADAYDDVGFSPGHFPHRDEEDEDADYDDVGPSSVAERIPANRCSTETLRDDSNLQIYDDVGPSAQPEPKTPATSPSDNEYSSIDENDDADLPDETYDDVRAPSHEERVNSLYAGFDVGRRINSNGRESEWEDLEDVAAPGERSDREKKTDSRSRRKVVNGRSRGAGRRKSRTGRRSRPNSRYASRTDLETAIDTASDDSNYETLFSSFPSDEFSSGTDGEGDEGSVKNNWPQGSGGNDARLQPIPGQEAPSRPVPPPPRESSLTESLGKRMKMLRRTWSITKGSLGRMRRRTSTTSNCGEANDPNGQPLDDGANKYFHSDPRKYFSFKKHFRKGTSSSNVTGLSRFYLGTSDFLDNERLSSNNNRSSKEEIYSNSSGESNWYTNSEYWRSSDGGGSENEHHYNVLDVEPLYQFYAAAAAARVAFESDSEGYEEVEDPMPCSPSSAFDLAKPGHRTLWCQTPRVKEGGFLQRLTPDEKKCQEAKFEILTSEASYLNSLRVLVDEFLNNHDLVHEVLTPSERDKLFGRVPGVLMASESLLAELETVWNNDPMLPGLPEILLNYAQRSSLAYVAYCSNQVSIDSTLKDLRSKKGSKFVETISRIESHSACQNLTLHSFLMLPMQRVTRLPLLVDAVLSKLSAENKEERKRWEIALSQLGQVVMECNEGARVAGRFAETEALERKLEYSQKIPPIALRDRYLIRRGRVVQMLAKSDVDYKLTFGKKYHKTCLYLFLLTDHLLIAKPKSSTNEETYTVVDTCKRNLIELEKVSEDSPFAGRNAMMLTLLENYSGRHVEYILTCESPTERERWLDAISPATPSLVGESLYETWDCPQVMVLYPYAAAQPDELSVQPGEVINVLRKMSDGWHLGEKLLGGEQGWFPGNYAKEVASEHVRAKNLRQRHRLMALNTSVSQQRKRV
ncbi:uncharacterized protein Exn [Venturia canescens]|uniref:uncharacterized protein Exn n=1 Tax=Venturia canescens TaxID=32260 RepID=UPI001C9D2869|nr:uncharacterized protein LOC122408144 [Venturia canescens]